MDILGAPTYSRADADDNATRTATRDHPIGRRLSKVGVVLKPSLTSGAFDQSIVESLFVGRDPATGRLAGTYTGYSGTVGTPVAGSVGLAYSDDGVYWQKAGQILTPSAAGSGAPDLGSITGPVWHYESGTYYLFYIGGSAAGYEQGVKTICLATATSLKGPWTKLGTMVAPDTTGAAAWRGNVANPAVWHVSLIKHRQIYYMFFNANTASGGEQIGYATAPKITGPWTVDDANSPVLTLGLATSGEQSKTGDPYVRRVGDIFVMDYFGTNAAKNWGAEFQAYTTAKDFPLGWKKYRSNPILVPTPGTFDSRFAHKPCLFVERGKVFHYYTADDGTNRTVALAVSSDPQVSSAYAVTDSFARANGTVGSAETGQAWTAGTGWALNGQQLKFTGTTDADCLIDSGLSDQFAMRFSTPFVVGGYSYAVQVRWVSSSNYVKVVKNPGNQWILNQSGTTSTIGAAAVATGDVVEVQVRGQSLRILVNEVEQAAAVLSSVGSSTLHGLAGSANVSVNIDDFSIRPL